MLFVMKWMGLVDLNTYKVLVWSFGFSAFLQRKVTTDCKYCSVIKITEERTLFQNILQLDLFFFTNKNKKMQHYFYRCIAKS